MADNKAKTADEAYAEWQKSVEDRITALGERLDALEKPKSSGKGDAALADRVASLEKMAGVSAEQAGVA